jgi:hypothetical protein
MVCEGFCGNDRVQAPPHKGCIRRHRCGIGGRSDDWNETPAKRDAMFRDCEEESNYHRCNGMSNEDVKEHIAPLENYSRDGVLVLSYPCAVYFDELAIEWLPQY